MVPCRNGGGRSTEPSVPCTFAFLQFQISNGGLNEYTLTSRWLWAFTLECSKRDGGMSLCETGNSFLGKVDLVLPQGEVPDMSEQGTGSPLSTHISIF